jgi:hypothetical protein
VRRLRTLPLHRLLLLLGVVAVFAVGAAVAVAGMRGKHAPPPAKPLASAIHDALAAPEPAGLTARVTFTNNLLPSGALLGGTTTPLLSGASGRLWLTNDGRGRIELQSDAGDVQLVWNTTRASLFDASTNTVYELTLPAKKNESATKKTPPTVAAISDFLTKLGEHWLVSATPTTVGGQPAYDASLAPKDTGSLLGSLRVAWDANQGVPLRVAVYAAGSSTPALELKTTSISYGSVPSSAVDVSPPAGAKVVDLGTIGTHAGGRSQKPKPVAAFDVVAPATLAGRTRTAETVVDPQLVLVHYGTGVTSLLLAEHDGASSSPLKLLPPVDLGVPAHELRTQLGTIVLWERNGVSFTLAGSVSAADAESAVRELVA